MKYSAQPDQQDLVSDGLMTVVEVAAFLSVGRSTVYQLMEKGELPFVKLGACRRIPKQALLGLATANLKGGWALAV